MPRIHLTAVSVCRAALSSWTPWEVCCRILLPCRAEIILLPASHPPLAVGCGHFCVRGFPRVRIRCGCDPLPYPFDAPADSRIPDPLLYPFDAPGDSRIRDPPPGSESDSLLVGSFCCGRRPRGPDELNIALVGARRSGRRPRGPDELNIALGTWGSSAGVRWLVGAKASGLQAERHRRSSSLGITLWAPTNPA